MIHVGVSWMAKCLELELRAHNTGYATLDIEKKIPSNICSNVNEILNEVDVVTETGIDVKGICDAINESYNFIKNDGADDGDDDDNDNDCEDLCEAIVSSDAGRYLCEYIFSKSLTIDRKRTMFVHVPELPVYPAKKTAKGLYDVIRYAVEKIQ